MESCSDPAGLAGPPRSGCAQRTPSSACRAARASWRAGRDLEHLLPRLGGALEILLAERAHDADVQQRLGVRRIDRERSVELRERPSGWFM